MGGGFETENLGSELFDGQVVLQSETIADIKEV